MYFLLWFVKTGVLIVGFNQPCQWLSKENPHELVEIQVLCGLISIQKRGTLDEVKY